MPVISLERAKEHLQVQHDLDDALIQVMLEAAVERTVAEIGLAGCLVSHEAVVDYRAMRFPYPVEGTPSVEGWVDDVWGAVPAEEYLVLSGNFDVGYELRIADNAPGTRWRVTWLAGLDPVPGWFVVAALFLCAHYYANRSTVVVGQGLAGVEVPLSFQHLTGPHRRVWFA